MERRRRVNIGGLVWKTLKLLVLLALTLAALAVVALVFWTQVKEWIYQWDPGNGFWGNDTPQFVHYVAYYLKHPHLPVNAWDYIWHNGAPRTIDLAWLQFTLSSLVAKAIGLYKTIKIYPVISFGLGVMFVYLLFYELSRSVLLSFGMAVSFVLGKGYYNALFSAGVVLSAISQMFLPAQLYFLARFLKRGGYRNLLLGSLVSVLGLASHGLMGMFFGLIPAFIFVLFSNRETDSLISKRTLFNALVFAVATLTVGAYVVWPHLLLALRGGSTSSFWGRVDTSPEVLKDMFAYTDQGIIYGIIASVPIGLLFFFLKKRFDKAVRPILVLLVLYLLWMVSYTVGGNPMFGVLFPGRIFWIFPLLLGSLVAALSAPLSEYRARNFALSVIKFLGFGLIKIAIFLAIIFSPVFYFRNIDNFLAQIEKPQEWQSHDVAAFYRPRHERLLKLVRPNETNVRVWSHDQLFNLSWILSSDLPLSEGYAHIWTYYSRLWEGWFYAVMSYPNWESEEIPRDMAKQQALFFLDWYGVKYMAATKDGGEWEVAPHFYEDPPYIKESKLYENGRSVFVVSPEYTSPLVSSVDVPVVGYVGSGEGYMTFVKDLAMLNLNPSYLIPVKLSETIGSIPADKLALVDALVIYEFGKGFPFFYSQGWGKVLDFAKNGGKVWIETGGNSIERENPRLPATFPITASQYGPLDEDWQPGGELAGEIDFSSLAALDYRGTLWKLSHASSDAVKTGASVLLTQKDHPIAVIQDVGKGKVLWTGANFWYRPEEFRQKGKGMAEVRVVELLLDELLGELPEKRVQSQVERSAPEHIKVTGQGFSGVVFKENHWPGWGATVEADGKKRKVPIFTAGPELMYIPIPEEMRTGEIKVLIDYRGDLFYWLCALISSISLLAVILYLVFGDRILGRFGLSKIAARFGEIKIERIKATISGWWEKGEDEY